MTQSKSFIFKDLVDEKNQKRCKVTIDVTEKISNNSEVYVIDFKYNYINTNGILKETCKIESPHPFANCDSSMIDFCDGEIVFKNCMTEQMVKYMLMEDEELCKFSGSTHPQQYRTLTMFNLMRLWD